MGLVAAKTDEKVDEEKAKDEEPSSAEKLNKATDAASDVLKKSGEELFNKLVQPKVEGEAEAKEDGYKKDETSDLDKLMDELEDKVVTTDESSTPVKEGKPQEIKKIDENL